MFKNHRVHILKIIQCNKINMLKGNNKNMYEIEKLRQGIKEMFNPYSYQWFISLGLPETSKFIEKYLKEWRISFCEKENIQICYCGVHVFSQDKGNHIHLLVNGKNRFGKTLLDYDLQNELEHKRLGKIWSQISHKSCCIEEVKDIEGIIDYFYLPRNTPINHFDVVPIYNIKLMEKYKL